MKFNKKLPHPLPFWLNFCGEAGLARERLEAEIAPSVKAVFTPWRRVDRVPVSMAWAFTQLVRELPLSVDDDG